MKIFCCPVCAGKCEVPYGFYGFGTALTLDDSTENFMYEQKTGTFSSTVQAMPEPCRSCNGKGFVCVGIENQVTKQLE